MDNGQISPAAFFHGSAGRDIFAHVFTLIERLVISESGIINSRAAIQGQQFKGSNIVITKGSSALV